MKLLIPLIACTALMLAGCQDKASTEQTVSTPDTETQTGSLRAYIDPVTGELTTPSEDEIRRQNLETSINTMDVRQAEPVEMIPLEGGGYRAPLGNNFQVESRATIQPDGSILIEETIKQPE
jgi:uncharacterized lipoprotein YajG